MKDWNRSDLNGDRGRLPHGVPSRGRDVRAVRARRRTSRRLDSLLERNYQAMKQLHRDDNRGRRDAHLHRLHLRRRDGLRPLRAQAARCFATGDEVRPGLRRAPTPRPPGSINYYLNENLVRDVLRDLHDHGRRPADPVERRLLPARRGADPRGHAAGSRATRRHCPAERTGWAGSSTCSAGCWARRQPDFLNAAGFSSSPHLMYSGTTGPTPASGSSSTRSVSAASPVARSGTVRTGTHCGRPSRTCRTSSLRRTSRCGSSCTRRWRTPAVRASSAAETEWTSRTGSSSPATCRSTTTAG